MRIKRRINCLIVVVAYENVSELERLCASGGEGPVTQPRGWGSSVDWILLLHYYLHRRCWHGDKYNNPGKGECFVLHGLCLFISLIVYYADADPFLN